MYRLPTRHTFAAFLALLLTDFALRAAFEPAGGSILDRAGFKQWVDGNETPVADETAKDGPASVLWTETSKPDWRGVKFGEGKATGVRHLRIGFTKEVQIGSVLVRGGGVLSVLKREVPYPGDLADE